MILMKRGHATRHQLHQAVETNRGNPEDATQDKIVDVVLHHLRRKIEPHGFTVHTIPRQGYHMSDADRRRLWTIIHESDEEAEQRGASGVVSR